MAHDELRRLLAAGGLGHPCDLDLLLFFQRHPTALMASEQIAAFAGYDLAQVAKSLDVLVRAGVLRRSLNPTHIGRLYHFTHDDAGAWLAPLLSTASTPEGRRQVIRLLMPQAKKSRGTNPSQPEASAEEMPEEVNNHA